MPINPPNQTADDENWVYQQTTNSSFDHPHSGMPKLISNLIFIVKI